MNILIPVISSQINVSNRKTLSTIQEDKSYHSKIYKSFDLKAMKNERHCLVVSLNLFQILKLKEKLRCTWGFIDLSYGQPKAVPSFEKNYEQYEHKCRIFFSIAIVLLIFRPTDMLGEIWVGSGCDCQQWFTSRHLFLFAPQYLNPIWGGGLET